MGVRAERKGRVLPFTLGEFRGWLLETAFRGSPENPVACAYCQRWMNSSTFVTDHEEPIAAGGSFGLNNLVLACAHCNRIKGRMSGEAFRALLMFVQTLPAWDANDMLGRMKNGAAFIADRAKSVASAGLFPVEY